MHQYHDVHSVLPPGKKGCCWGTWLVYVLPYLEQQPLFNAWNSCGINSPGVPANYDLDLRYFGAANVTVTSTRLGVYLCPSDLTNAPITATINGVTYACTSQNYAANFGNTTVLQADYPGHPVRRRPVRGHRFARWATTISRRRATVGFNAITDGHEQHPAPLRGRRRPGTGPARVLLVGRRRHLRDLLDPEQLVPRRALQPDLLHQPVARTRPAPSATTALPEMYAARSRHPGGVNVAMADGSVRFIKDSVNLQIWRVHEHDRGSRSLRLRSLLTPARGITDDADSRDRPHRPDPRAPPMARHAAELAGAAVPALADPARGVAPARPAATGARPLRGDRLRRPGPVHHDGRPTRRAAARPRAIQLPRDERADLRPPRRPRPRRLVLQPRRGQPGRGRPGPEPVTTSLTTTRGCSWSARPRPAPTIPGRSSTRASAAGPIPAPRPTSSAPPRPARSGPAQPGTLEHFLVERYILYALANDRLYRGQVHHHPYPLQSADVLSLDESLLAAADIRRPDRPPLAHFARGVDVKVYAIQPAT